MLLRTLLLIGTGLAALGGCAADLMCTEEIRQSVTMTVSRADGGPVEDIVVHYRVDHGPLREASCFPDADGYCSQWVAGEEEEGLFQIEATTPTGTAMTHTYVTNDGCHVETQQLELIID